MNIHLFRHGQVAGPAALYGKTDIALSQDGQDALLRATGHLQIPSLIITSPLQRCSAFATRKAEELGCALEVDTGLREMDFGTWDGAPYQEDNLDWPKMEQFWQRPAEVTPPGGESLLQMQKRVSSSWRKIESYSQETIWVFAHGGVIRLIIAEILALDWRSASLYCNLQVGYASRTDVQVQCSDQFQSTRVQAIAVPVPAISTP